MSLEGAHEDPFGICRRDSDKRLEADSHQEGRFRAKQRP